MLTVGNHKDFQEIENHISPESLLLCAIVNIEEYIEYLLDLGIDIIYHEIESIKIQDSECNIQCLYGVFKECKIKFLILDDDILYNLFQSVEE